MAVVRLTAGLYAFQSDLYGIEIHSFSSQIYSAAKFQSDLYGIEIMFLNHFDKCLKVSIGPLWN